MNMRKRLTTILLAAALTGMMVSASPAQAEADNGVSCREERVTVQHGWTVAGTWCEPEHGEPNQMLVLVPGATYNRWYFDPDYKSDTYSLAWQAAESGSAVFAIDRLGTGKSSKPLSALITGSVQARALSYVTRWAGEKHDVPTFLVGHSLGSAESLLAVADHDPDVAGLVLTGFSTSPDMVALTYLITTRFKPSGVGYLTTHSGVRDAAFHQPGHAEAAMVTADEANKDRFPITELPDAMALVLLLRRSVAVDVPVLVINGAQDSIFCGTGSARDCSTSAALAGAESRSFPDSPCVAALSVSRVGHDASLHPTSPDTHASLLDWTAAVNRGECPVGSWR